MDAALYSDDQELTAQSKQILYSYQISNNEMTTLFTDRLLNHTPLSTQLRDDKLFIISQTEDFEAEINLFQANNQDHVYQGIIHHPKPDMAFFTPVF